MKYQMLTLALSVLLALPATAQISTDRPGFAFSPTTVGKGVFQVEAGTPDVTAISVSGFQAQYYRFPVALRFGVTEAIEVRLGTSVFEVVRRGGNSDSEVGFDVLEAGAKLNLLSGDTEGATFSLLPSVLIPTEGGDIVFSTNGVVGYALPNAFSFVGVAGVAASENDVAGTVVALLGRSLTDTLGGYTEIGVFPSENNTPAYAGAGLTLLVNRDAQLDVYFDRGLNDDASDWLFGAGFSFRLR